MAGFDGVPAWHASQEAARRAEDADIDAFRPVLPARVASHGVEGDLGPAEESRFPGPAPKRPAFEHRALALLPPRARARATDATAADAVLSRIARPAVTPPSDGLSPPALAMLQRLAPAKGPPSGPWDQGKVATAPPAHPEGAGVGVVMPTWSPARATKVQAANASVESPDPPTATDPAQAFKAAMRPPGVDEWRPPKPEMPGAPGGKRGGKGKNIAGLAGPGMAAMLELAAARKAAEDANLALQRVNTDDLGTQAIGSDPGSYEGPQEHPSEKLWESIRANVRLAEAEKAYSKLLGGAGSQVEKRILEELIRENEARLREEERERKRAKTKPNYAQWKTGAAAMQTARDARDSANRSSAAAGRIMRGVPSGQVSLVQVLINDAKSWAKQAKAAGKRAKNAAKYGTPAEAKHYAGIAETLAGVAEIAAEAAESALKDAEAKGKAGEKGGAGAGPKKRSGVEGRVPQDPPEPGARIPVATEVLVSCFANPAEVCGPCAPECRTGEKCVCNLVYVEPEAVKDPPKTKETSVKGRGMEPLDSDLSSTDGRAATPKDGSRDPGISGGASGAGGRTRDAAIPADTSSTRSESSEASRSAPAAETPEDGEAVSPEGGSTAAPPSDGAGAKPKDSVSDEQLREEASETLAVLFLTLQRLETKISSLRSALMVLLRKSAEGKALKAGESRALSRDLVEIAVYTEARAAVEGAILGTLHALGEGLRSHGKAREDAFFEVRVAESEVPRAVRKYVDDSMRAIRKSEGELPPPDDYLRALRQDVEWEVDRRLPESERQDPKARDRVRAQVLDERERGEAPGLGTLIAQSVSEAAAATPGAVVGTALEVLDAATGRPLRAGILAARDLIHGSAGTEGSVWSRAAMGKFTDEVVRLYSAGLESADASPWQIVGVLGIARAAELSADFLGGAAGIKMLGAARRIVSVHGGAGVADDAVVVYRGMKAKEHLRLAELAARGEQVTLESSAQFAKQDIPLNLWRYLKHPFRGKAPSPYISTSKLSKVGETFAMGVDEATGAPDVVVRLVVRRGDLTKSIALPHAEYLVAGDTVLLEAPTIVSRGPLTYGRFLSTVEQAPAREIAVWAAETSAFAAAEGVSVYYGTRAVIEASRGEK